MKKTINYWLIIVILAAWRPDLAAQGSPILVFPGDANANGQVSNLDFLYLGLGYNYFGPARDSFATAALTFAPQAAQPWYQTQANGSNLAHADCDGDGIINYYFDAFPIYVNYGLQRDSAFVTPDEFERGVPGIDPALYFEDDNLPGNLHGGSQFTLPLILGSADIPAEDLYGIAFSVFVDPVYIDPSDVDVNFNLSSWANPDNDRIFMHRTAANDRLDIAWVRTDHNHQSGFGQIGSLDLIIIIDVIGQQEFSISIDRIKMVDKYGNEHTVAGDTISIAVMPESSGVQEADSRQLRVLPNPAKDQLRVQCIEPMTQLILRDPFGRAVFEAEPRTTDARLVLPGLPAGIYLLEVRTERGVLVKKVSIQP